MKTNTTTIDLSHYNKAKFELYEANARFRYGIESKAVFDLKQAINIGSKPKATRVETNVYFINH